MPLMGERILNFILCDMGKSDVWMLGREYSTQYPASCDHGTNEMPAGDPASEVERYSFDVFDTAICRLVHSPEHVHLLVGRVLRDRGITSCSDVEWLRVRVDAETKCRRQTKKSEITIADIYRQIARTVSLSYNNISIALDTELETELKILKPIRHTSDRIFQLIRSRRKVFFLSDIYMTSSHVRTLLLGCGYDASLEVIASSEELKSKAAGDLYAHVAQNSGLSGSAFHHVGDNFASDYKNAKASGWNSEHFTRSHPTSREQAIFAASQGDFLSSLVAGCARATRLSSKDSDNEGIITTSSSVIGPILAGYLLWLILDVHSRGGRTVHFIAGDSRLMVSVCERVANWLGIAIDARHISVSSEALQMAALAEDDAELAGQAIAMIINDAPESTLAEAIVGKLQYSPCDLAAISRLSGISSSERIADLPGTAIDMLIETLGTSPFLKSLSSRRSRAKGAVLDYLASTGFFAGPEVTLADVDCRGTSKQRLQAIVGDRVNILGYHISLESAALARDPESRAWTSANWNKALLQRMMGADRNVCDQDETAEKFVEYFTGAIDPRLYPPSEVCSVLKNSAQAAFRHFLLCPSLTEVEAYGCDPAPANPSRPLRPEITKVVNSFDMFMLPFDGWSRDAAPHWRMGTIVRSQHKIGPALVANFVSRALDLAIRFRRRWNRLSAGAG